MHQEMGKLGYLYTTPQSLLVEAAPVEIQPSALAVFPVPKLSVFPQDLREHSGQERGSHTEVGSCAMQGTDCPARLQVNSDVG